jgi:hypothetical protein
MLTVSDSEEENGLDLPVDTSAFERGSTVTIHLVDPMLTGLLPLTLAYRPSRLFRGRFL